MQAKTLIAAIAFAAASAASFAASPAAAMDTVHAAPVPHAKKPLHHVAARKAVVAKHHAVVHHPVRHAAHTLHTRHVVRSHKMVHPV